MNNEREIITTLLKNQITFRKYVTHIKPSFFEKKEYSIIIDLVNKHFQKYNSIPDKNVIESELESNSKIVNEYNSNVSDCKDCVSNLFDYNFDYRKNKEWIQERLSNFIMSSKLKEVYIECYDYIKNGNFEPILDNFKEVFSISFDDNFGLEYFDTLEDRYARMQEKVEVFSTGISSLDRLIGGGWRRKTLNIVAGPANSGKTMWMVNFARNAVKNGKNVVYFTFEISEDEIAKRFDAGFGKIKMNELIEEKDFVFGEIRKAQQSGGQLIIKEYAPRVVNCNHLIGFLKDLEDKRNIKPDLIVIDYLSLMNPNKKVKDDSLYQRGMNISIDLRAMAYELNACTLTGAQINRCLAKNTLVVNEDGKDIELKKIKIGDKIIGKNGKYRTVTKKYDPTLQKAYRIKLKSGKTIICSSNHQHMTGDGLKTIDGGLSPGDCLYVSE